MARVTVEDCLDYVENRFKLVLLASKRARQLSMGTEPLVEWENDKPTVVALREIEQGLVNEEMMQAALAQPIEEELPFDEDDLAAALHAEISHELNQSALKDRQLSEPQAFSSSLNVAEKGQSGTLTNHTIESSTEKETSSMESLLAQELDATSGDSSASSKPFGESSTDTQESSSDYWIPTPPSSADMPTDGD